MKLLIKCLFLYVTLFSCSNFYGQSKKTYKTHLVDNADNPVAFFIRGSNGSLLKSNSDGVLQLSSYQINKYKKEIFTLHFSNHLAYFVYRINLYYKKGKRINDKHIKYNKITIENLSAKEDNIFYLRRKEIRLDSENE